VTRAFAPSSLCVSEAGKNRFRVLTLGPAALGRLLATTQQDVPHEVFHPRHPFIWIAQEGRKSERFPSLPTFRASWAITPDHPGPLA
jgi:hypothetical protein